MVRKSESEIALIRESGRWCEHAHRLLQEYTRPGVTEAEASLRQATRRRSRCSRRSATASAVSGLPTAHLRATAVRSACAAPGPRHRPQHRVRARRRARDRDGRADLGLSRGARARHGHRAAERRGCAGSSVTRSPPSRPPSTRYARASRARTSTARSCAISRTTTCCLLAPAHGARDRPPQPRGAVPRPRRPHADRGGHGVHDRAGLYADDIGGFRHSDTVVVMRRHRDLHDYPSDIESLTLPV